MENNSESSSQQARRWPWSNPSSFALLLVLLAIVGMWYLQGDHLNRSVVDYSFFRKQLDQNNVAEVEFHGQTLLGRFRQAPDAPPRPAETAREAAKPKTDSSSDVADQAAARPAKPAKLSIDFET